MVTHTRSTYVCRACFLKLSSGDRSEVRAWFDTVRLASTRSNPAVETMLTVDSTGFDLVESRFDGQAALRFDEVRRVESQVESHRTTLSKPMLFDA